MQRWTLLVDHGIATPCELLETYEKTNVLSGIFLQGIRRQGKAKSELRIRGPGLELNACFRVGVRITSGLRSARCEICGRSAQVP